MTNTNERMPAWLESVWVQRYLDRELTDEESEWLEMYVLDKPDLLAIIEFDSGLRDGVSAAGLAAASIDRLRDLRDESTPSRAEGRWRPLVALARAAGILIAAAGGWFAASLFHASPQGSEVDLVTNPARLVFDIQRGPGQPPLVFESDPRSPFILVEVGVPLDAEEVFLLRAGDVPQRLIVSSEGFVSFLWPRHGPQSTTVPDLSYRSGGDVTVRPLDLSPALKGASP